MRCYSASNSRHFHPCLLTDILRGLGKALSSRDKQSLCGVGTLFCAKFFTGSKQETCIPIQSWKQKLECFDCFDFHVPSQGDMTTMTSLQIELALLVCWLLSIHGKVTLRHHVQGTKHNSTAQEVELCGDDDKDTFFLHHFSTSNRQRRMCGAGRGRLRSVSVIIGGSVRGAGPGEQNKRARRADMTDPTQPACKPPIVAPRRGRTTCALQLNFFW